MNKRLLHISTKFLLFYFSLFSIAANAQIGGGILKKLEDKAGKAADKIVNKTIDKVAEKGDQKMRILTAPVLGQKTAIDTEIGATQSGGILGGTYVVSLNAKPEKGVVRTNVVLEYETYTVPDKIIVAYAGKVVWESGCVGTNGLKEQTISVEGKLNEVVVLVNGGCAGGGNAQGTRWTFKVTSYKKPCDPCPYQNKGCFYMIGGDCDLMTMRHYSDGDYDVYTGWVSPGSVKHDLLCKKYKEQGINCFACGGVSLESIGLGRDECKNSPAECCEWFGRAIEDVGGGNSPSAIESIVQQFILKDATFKYGYKKTVRYKKGSCKCDNPDEIDFHAPSGTPVRDENDAWFCKSGQVECVQAYQGTGHMQPAIPVTNCKCK